MKKIVFSLIAGLAAMSAAHAEGPYAGASVVTAKREISTPAGATGMTGDGWGTSGKIFAGYDLDKTWGVELGYTDFRSKSASYTVGSTTTSADTSGHSVYLAGKAMMPINDQFSAYAKLGIADNKGEQGAFSSSKTEAYGALGLQYNLTKQVALVGEYERYGKKKDFGPSADVWSAGVKFNF